MKYFSHETNGRHGQVVALIGSKFGKDGRLAWWDLMEIICEKTDYSLPTRWSLDADWLAMELEVKPEWLRKFLDYIASKRPKSGAKRFTTQWGKDGIVTIEYPAVLKHNPEFVNRAHYWHRQQEKRRRAREGEDPSPPNPPTPPLNTKTRQDKSSPVRSSPVRPSPVSDRVVTDDCVATLSPPSHPPPSSQRLERLVDAYVEAHPTYQGDRDYVRKKLAPLASEAISEGICLEEAQNPRHAKPYLVPQAVEERVAARAAEFEGTPRDVSELGRGPREKPA